MHTWLTTFFHLVVAEQQGLDLQRLKMLIQKFYYALEDLKHRKWNGDMILQRL